VRVSSLVCSSQQTTVACPLKGRQLAGVLLVAESTSHDPGGAGWSTQYRRPASFLPASAAAAPTAFSAALESTLHRALVQRQPAKHEYATLEHLLLALIDDVDASEVMKTCKVDFGALM
jgi:Clp amino terminal domain, pathogenicity island component